MKTPHSFQSNCRWCGSLAAIATIWCLTGSQLHAQQAFRTPEKAASAFASAVKSGTESKMLKVLGKGGKDIIDSGDAVADAAVREKFTAAYDTKHSVSSEGDKKAVMIVGSENGDVPLFVEHCEAAVAEAYVMRRWLDQQGRCELSFSFDVLAKRHGVLEVACAPSIVGSLWRLPAWPPRSSAGPSRPIAIASRCDRRDARCS